MSSILRNHEALAGLSLAGLSLAGLSLARAARFCRRIEKSISDRYNLSCTAMTGAYILFVTLTRFSMAACRVGKYEINETCIRRAIA